MVKYSAQVKDCVLSVGYTCVILREFPVYHVQPSYLELNYFVTSQSE